MFAHLADYTVTLGRKQKSNFLIHSSQKKTNFGHAQKLLENTNLGVSMVVELQIGIGFGIELRFMFVGLGFQSRTP